MLTVIDNYYKVIIIVQLIVILFFLAACILHDYIPVCHYLFLCDHRMH